MLFHFDQLGYTNWATYIRKLLYNNGFGYLWELQEVINEKRFLHALQQTIKDQFLQTWYTEVFLNSKLNWYSEFKTEFTHEPYLNVVKIRKYRRALASFRISNHRLQVEKGGNLGHVTWAIYTNFSSPFLRMLHMKFKFDWPSGFREEDV